MLTKIFHSFTYAVNGLVTTWKEELNFRIELFFGLLVVICIFVFNFNFIESIFCVFAIIMVLTSEIINTAVEDLCNKVEPKHDQIIAKIKDTMAGFVFVTGFGAFIIGIVVFYHHFLL